MAERKTLTVPKPTVVDYVVLSPGGETDQFLKISGYDERIVTPGAVEWSKGGITFRLIPMWRIEHITTEIEDL